MLRQSNQKDRELHKVKIYMVVLPWKSWKSLEDLDFIEVLPMLLYASFRFFSPAALALRIFFSSSESEARSSILYSVLVSSFDQLLTLFDD